MALIRAAVYHASDHLTESELRPAAVGCPICGQPLPAQPLAMLQRDPDVRLLRCSRCHGCWASRMPTEAALERYYGTYYDLDQEHKVTLDGPARFARHIFRFAPSGNSLDILDFGGGDGSLGFQVSQRAGRSGRVVLMDHNQHPCDPSIEVHPADHWPQGSFDLVIASAVFEHIPEFASSLMRLAGKLKPGGRMYIRTPAMAGFARLGIDFTFPAHVYDLGQAFWESAEPLGLLGETRLRIIRSAPSLVETTLRRHLITTVAAYALKAPWRLFGSRYTLVGGWEVVFERPLH